MYRDSAQVFQDIGLWDDGSATITGRGEPEQVQTLNVTDGTLACSASARRSAAASRAKTTAAPAPKSVMISHRYWQRVFSGSPVGDRQSLMVNGRRARSHRRAARGLPVPRPQPRDRHAVQVQPREIHAAGFSYQGIARLKPGVTIEQANADVARLMPTLIERFPLPPGFTRKMFDEVKLRPLVRPLDVDVVGDIGNDAVDAARHRRRSCCSWRARTSRTCSWCAPRAGSRSWRCGWRLAARRGASHGSCCRSRCWSRCSAACSASALAYGGIQLLVYLQPAQLPRLKEITLDPIVLLFTLALSLRGGPAVRRHPGAEVRAAAPGVRAEGQLARIERRPRAASRAQHARRRAGRAGRRAAGGVGPDGPHVSRHSRRAAGLHQAGGSADAAHLDPAGGGRRCRRRWRSCTNKSCAASRRSPAWSSVGVDVVAARWTATTTTTRSGSRTFPSPEGQIPTLRRHKWIGEGYFETMGNHVVAGRAITWRDAHTRRRS